MIDKKIITNLISFVISALFIVLFIFLLPSILILVGVLVILMIIVALVFRFLIYKGKIKMNFVYRNEDFGSRKNDVEEIYEMKDVTNSAKSGKIKD